MVEVTSEAVWKQMSAKFQKIKIMEHQANYYKFRIGKHDTTIGALFGFIEDLVHFILFYADLFV